MPRRDAARAFIGGHCTNGCLKQSQSAATYTDVWVPHFRRRILR